MAGHMHNNGYLGRQLYRLFKKQGLVNVGYEIFPLAGTSYAFARQAWSMDDLEREALARKIVIENELKNVQRELEQADADGALFGYCCMILVVGQEAG